MINNILKNTVLLTIVLFTYKGVAQRTVYKHFVEEKNCDTLTLKINETKFALNNEVKIKYSTYSHEHSSSSPDQPFEASIGVYNFEFTTNKVTETITIYLAVNQQNSAVDWKQYKITLFSSTPDQKEVIVGVSHLE